MADGDGLQPPKDTPGFIKAVGEEVFQKLRVESPPTNGWLKYEKIALAFLTAGLTFMGVAYWRGADAADKLEATAKEARAEIEILKKERATRIAQTDARFSATDAKFDAIEVELRTYRIAFAEFQEMKGTVKSINFRLDEGKAERLKDRDAMAERINRIDVGWQLLQQRVEGRNGGAIPFGRDQSWPFHAPPYDQRARTVRPPISPLVREVALGSRRG